MLTVPTITATIVVRKCRLQPFKSHIRATHDSLAHVVKAVDHVPVMVFFKLMTRSHTGIDCDDSIEAVELVGHGCREDSSVGPDDGSGKVVVVLWVRNALKAHADCVGC